MALFHGLSAFPITPTYDDGRVDTDGIRRLVGRLAVAKVDSIGLLGSTGTAPYLPRDERRSAIKAAVEEAGPVPVMVGIGALRTDEVLRLRRDAKDEGASAVLLAPVDYIALTDHEVYTHFETVATVFHCPNRSGSSYPCTRPYACGHPGAWPIAARTRTDPDATRPDIREPASLAWPTPRRSCLIGGGRARLPVGGVSGVGAREDALRCRQSLTDKAQPMTGDRPVGSPSPSVFGAAPSVRPRDLKPCSGPEEPLHDMGTVLRDAQNPQCAARMQVVLVRSARGLVFVLHVQWPAGRLRRRPGFTREFYVDGHAPTVFPSRSDHPPPGAAALHVRPRQGVVTCFRRPAAPRPSQRWSPPGPAAALRGRANGVTTHCRQCRRPRPQRGRARLNRLADRVRQQFGPAHRNRPRVMATPR
ncbi:hypothetical protein P3T39_005666 [Kitasatospora sp. GP82]|nr:hypothetical protein [Kitasatospora sp. GP82]